MLNERTWDAIEWSVAYSESFSWDQLHADFTRFVKIANTFKKIHLLKALAESGYGVLLLSMMSIV